MSNQDIQIIPAILATTEEEYRNKMARIGESGVFNGGWVQIDFMDNKFVPNQSIGPDIVVKYPTALKKEAHLMVEYPENWIDDLVKIEVERVVFPVEDEAGIEERIKHLKNHQIEVGLSVNPQTPIEKLLPFIGTIDLVLIMSIEPGFGGQQFIPETLEKIKQVKQLLGENNVIIEVDGGINEDNVKGIIEAGANNIVIGEHLINGQIAENLENIWQAIRD